MSENSNGKEFKEFAGEFSLSLLFVGGMLAFSQCCSSFGHNNSDRYESCMKATESIEKCGKP